MGFESFSESEDVIRNLPSPWVSSIYKICDNPERRDRRKWVHQPVRLFPCVYPGKKGVYGGKSMFLKRKEATN